MDEEFQDHDPRVVQALGELTIAFGTLEENIRESIWWVLGGNEERAQIMTAGLSFPVLVEKLAALVAQKFDHLLLPEPMDELRIRMLSINERRNRLVHSLWILDAGTGMSVAERKRARPGVGIDWQSVDVPLEDIERLLADIGAAAAEVFELIACGDDAFKALGPKRIR